MRISDPDSDDFSPTNGALGPGKDGLGAAKDALHPAKQGSLLAPLWPPGMEGRSGTALPPLCTEALGQLLRRDLELLLRTSAAVPGGLKSPGGACKECRQLPGTALPAAHTELCWQLPRSSLGLLPRAPLPPEAARGTCESWQEA